MSSRRIQLAIAVCVIAGLGAVAVTSTAQEVAAGGPGGLAFAEPVSEQLAAAPVVSRSALDAAWFDSADDLPTRAVQTRRAAIEVGADNVEPAARALIQDSAAPDPLQRAMLAVRLAPDLPSTRMALASAFWAEGERAKAAAEVGRGLAAIPQHLEASVWVASTWLVLVAVVLVVGAIFFIVMLAVSVVSHASHDLGDLFSRRMPGFARTALLGSLVLVPLLLGEGALGLAAGLLALGFTYGNSRDRMALVLAVALIVLGMYPIARIAGMALTSLDSDPVAQASLSVARDVGSPAELALLREAAAEDPLAELALAIHTRRSGDIEAAHARYTELLKRVPRDPVVLTNLANLRFLRNDQEAATELYQRSSGLTDSATLQFNLSQSYAKSFRIEEFENALQVAQRIDPEVVNDLSQVGNPDFVADLPFPVERVRDRMISGADGRGFARQLRAPFAPGRLGESWMTTTLGFAGAAFLGLLVGGRYDHSSRCRRCGQRVCGRCDGTVWNSETCESCYTLYHRPETTDSGLRMVRLTQLRKRESRIDRIATAASFIVPGVAGLLARRPDLGFVGILLFFWAAFAFIWRDGIVPDPLAVGAAGPLAFLITGVMAALGYLAVVATCLLIRRSL